jgi:hypothetical protein
MLAPDIADVLDREHDRASSRPVTPTDVSQFIRLDQCQRYLRLQLHLRQEGEQFLRDYDVAMQSIPPILTRSGETFEQMVEGDTRERFPVTRFEHPTGSGPDIAEVLGIVRALQRGETHVLFQPRLRAQLGKWRLSGDIDILRVERDSDGTLQCLIADMKSSTASKVEHRLQVAIYHEMVEAILADARIDHAPIELAILYRGPVDGTVAADEADEALLAAQRADALATLGTEHGYLERIEDKAAYLGSVADLLTGETSVAERVVKQPFAEVPFHLTYKCDGCRFNEFCMKQSAEHDDLSLLPHLSDQDKTVLRKAKITSVQEVAGLKELVTNERGEQVLQPVPGKEELCRQLAVTWPVGKRLDELIHRAQRYRAWRKQGPAALTYIPHRGYGTLPYSGPDLHPNLVRVYIDAQHDYLHDRIYMVGALVVASENGVEVPQRRRSIVRMTPAPPDTNDIEKALFLDWTQETLRAVVELAAPDENGQPTAPIHLIFVNRFAQKQLLNGLGRYLDEVLGATPLYDFITQLAMFDSPIASFLEEEIRQQKNYPMVCQSLQAVAAFLKFDWNRDVPYRDLFRGRMFDFWRKFSGQDEEESPGINGWYTGRSRFNSQVPLEYAYGAWGDLIPGADPDAIAFYELATPQLMTGFHARRLEAMEHIAKDFRGNRQTQLTSFVLPELATFEQRAPTLAHALHEFVMIERFVQLAAWKSERLDPPEQRVLNGVSLLVRYVEADQDPGIAERYRENAHRIALRERYTAEFLAANPTRKRPTFTQEQKEETDWSHDGMQYRLRLELDGVDCSLEDAINLSTIKPGERLVLMPRWSVDERLPESERRVFTTTAKQILYGPRVQLVDIVIERDDAGVAVRAHAVVEVAGGGGKDNRGFLFGARTAGPMEADLVYTLDPDPNNINGFWQLKVIDGLIAGGENPVYSYLTGQPTSMPIVPSPDAAMAQRTFMDGLVALHDIGAMYAFEESKHEFIGEHGDDPVLLVQGPPGTGKSFSTAFALLARIQGAMASGASYRVMLSCKTHAATDVLLRNVLQAQETLRGLFALHPGIMERFFDRRLLDVPLFRQRPRGDVAEGITPFPGSMKATEVVDTIRANSWSVTASTPGGIYNMVKDRLFGETFIDCVVLDEASQMSIPEAIMATLPLEPDGRLIVVGDHRQMPPIISHDWENETRRTFSEFRSYESLFMALLEKKPPKIHFEESFRLHADLAEFLRKEIYSQDQINYHSNLTDVLPEIELADDFVDAVLSPAHPLTVVVHDEVESQQRNRFEQDLIAPVLEALASEEAYGLTPEKGLGVVVPHRAQRAALQGSVEALVRRDPETNMITVSAVDTVERFQGDERTVILVSATESDPQYLLMAGDFLLDPRRLTVALSRAKRKMVLVASRSVFEFFSADEEMFRNSQLWKTLLRQTCTERLWDGERNKHRVEVWGNPPLRHSGRGANDEHHRAGQEQPTPA